MSKVVFGERQQYFPYELPSHTSVLVGNVPYNMGEEQLIEVFKSVGQVVGFRCVAYDAIYHQFFDSFQSSIR